MSNDDIKAYLVDMKTKNIKWGSAGLPVDFRKDDATFKEGLKPLPDYARAMEKAEATRMNTWILSFDHSLNLPRKISSSM